jgi:uncharacterized membrane protein YdfJ with MMPL/SSD domain
MVSMTTIGFLVFMLAVVAIAVGLPLLDRRQEDRRDGDDPEDVGSG